MKNLLLILCLCFICSISYSQPLLEKILSNEIKLAISDGTRYDDGTWIFSAYAYSVSPGDSAMSIVFKTDSAFSPLWAKRLKSLRNDDLSCITPLMDGNVLVGGAMRQNFSLENGGSVFKMDTAGNVLWHLMYDEDSDDRVLDIFEQADSSLMIFIREGVNNRPTKIVHADKGGVIISQRTYTVGSNLGLLANNVVVDENEQYYFSGTVFQGTSELFVCAVSDDSLLWYKRYRFQDDRGVGNFSSAYNPVDQSILLGGAIADTVGIFVNIWLAKMDLTGNLIWIKEYGRDLGYTESISSITPLPNGDIMLYGSVFDDQGSQGYAMKLDSVGNILWIKGYNPTSPTLGIADAFHLPDGRTLLNANSGNEIFLLTTSAEGLSACNSSTLAMNVVDLSASDSTYFLNVDDPGIQEFIPVLEVSDIVIDDSVLCAGSVGIEEIPAGKLVVYPNPAKDQLAVILPTHVKHPAKCMIVDARGRKIIPAMTQGQGEIQLDISGLPNGIYWVFLQADDKIYSQKFIRL